MANSFLWKDILTRRVTKYAHLGWKKVKNSVRSNIFKIQYGYLWKATDERSQKIKYAWKEVRRSQKWCLKICTDEGSQKICLDSVPG